MPKIKLNGTVFEVTDKIYNEVLQLCEGKRTAIKQALFIQHMTLNKCAKIAVDLDGQLAMRLYEVSNQLLELSKI